MASRRSRRGLCLVFCVAALAAQVQASTITALSPAIDVSSITPYANSGYYLFATGTGGGAVGAGVGTDISQLPSYVATFNKPTANEATGYGYASVGTPSSGTVTTGTITDGSSADKFSFVLGNNTPSSFEVGLLVDNLDSAGFNASSLTLSSSGGVTAATELEGAGNRTPDVYLFQVSGATHGETFTVGATQGANGDATIAGITFASPEPSSLVLGGLGALGLAAVARRRRKA